MAKCNIQEVNRQLDAEREASRKLFRTIAFFASVIKSGERWTEHCETAYREAVKTATPAIPGGGSTMTHRIFTVRPPVWWMRFSPEWRDNRERLERWLHAHQMEILSYYRDETLTCHLAEEVQRALFQDIPN